MPSQSSFHTYTEWAKGRLDEMDATIAALEAKVHDLNAEARSNAETRISDMRARRDDFQSRMEDYREQTEASWAEAKAQMEGDWNAFEADFKDYAEAVKTQGQEQLAALQARAGAQTKSWSDAVTAFQEATSQFHAEHKTELDAALDKMKGEASTAMANLDRLNQAGAESWNAFSKALADSRAALDRANEATHAAFKKARK